MTKQIERLITSDPENKILHQRGMQLALKMSDLSLAIAHLKQAVRIEFSEEEDGFLADLILQKGLIEMQLGGKYLGSLGGRMYGNIVNYTTKYYEALAYLLGDRKKEALKTIGEMLVIKPDNVEAYILKGRQKSPLAKTLWAMEDNIQGNACMWQAYLIDPKHPEVCEFILKVEPAIRAEVERASDMILKEQYDQALAYLKRGSDKNKNDFDIGIMRSYALRKQKNFKDAIFELECMESYLSKLHPQALPAEEIQKRRNRISENLALLYNDLAANLFDQKDFKDASVLFMQAKNFKINDPGILCNIGDCALVSLNHEETQRTEPGSAVV